MSGGHWATEREARIVKQGAAFPEVGDSVQDDSGAWWRVARLGWVAEPRIPGTGTDNYCAAYLVADANPRGRFVPKPGRVVFPPAGWEAEPRWGHV